MTARATIAFLLLVSAAVPAAAETSWTDQLKAKATEAASAAASTASSVSEDISRKAADVDVQGIWQTSKDAAAEYVPDMQWVGDANAAAFRYWDGFRSEDWIPASMAPTEWSQSLTLPEGWSVVGWVKSVGSSDMAVKFQKALSEAAGMVPQDPLWWRDFGITTTVVGSTVGTATFGCAVIATPGGPIVAAVAGGTCGIFAASGGEQLVRQGYAWAGETLDEGALKAGVVAGRLLGSIGGSMGYRDYAEWMTFRHYKDFGGYAKVARSLTAKNLKGAGNVAQLRKAGYDMDHVIPVKCGWAMGIAPAAIASLSNMHALPSSVNRSIGSKGC